MTTTPPKKWVTVALYLQDDDPTNREFGCDQPDMGVRLTVPDDTWRGMGEPEWVVVQITPSRAPREDPR